MMMLTGEQKSLGSPMSKRKCCRTRKMPSSAASERNGGPLPWRATASTTPAGTGTDVAMQSAGVTLVKGDLAGVARAQALSRATMRNIRENCLHSSTTCSAFRSPLPRSILPLDYY